MEPTLASNARARAAVSAFLGGESSSDEEDVDAAVLTLTRPNRLGLGATEETEKTKPEVGSQRARSRLERSIQSQREKEANAAKENGAESDGYDSGNEEESRTRTVGKKRKRARKVVIEAKKKPVVETKVVKNNDEIGGTSTEEKATENNTAGEMKAETKAEKVWHFGGATHGADELNPPRRKRKKTRSRQKNLRRDKRPKHMLPAHLTEETLKAGRLPRHDSAEGGASVEQT